MESNLKDKPTKMINKSILTKKLKFEKLISAISSQFVGNYDLDIVINEALAKMGESTNASRVFLFVIDIQKEYMKNTHEWCNKNIDSHINDYTHLSLQDFPWVIDQLSKAKPIIINDISDLPSEAKKVKNLLMNQGVKSNLTIPLYINGDLGGFIGFDDDLKSRGWLDEDLNLLQISSRIIGNALERKFTEEKLKESEERFRLLFDNAIDGILLADSESKKFYSGNKKICQMLGLTLEEIKNLSIMDIHPNEDLPYVIEQFEKQSKGEISLAENIPVINKEGNIFYADINSSPIDLGEKTYLMGIFRDVTERKKAEKEINLAKTELDQIFNTSIPMYITDLNYNIIKVNDRFCDFFQIKKGEIIGKKCFDVWNGPLCESPECSLKQILSGKDECEYEMEKALQDNIKISSIIVKNFPFFSQNNELIGIIKNFIDITERKKTEQKLKVSEEKYRSVLENIKEGYFEVDLKVNFTFFNDALCESSGYSREELRNTSYSMVFDEETKERIFRVYNDLYKKGEGSTLIEYQILKKNGMRTYHESSVYLRSDPNGEIIGFKGFVRDISERKKVEALRKKFSQELEKEVDLRTKELKVALDYQKLYLDQILKASNFKTEFLATMSHELRTPLNAIIGFTDLLLEGVYGRFNSEQLEYILDIEESSKHLLEMISHILDISKIESGQVTVKIDKIQLYSIVEQVISTLKPLYTKKDLKIELRGLKKSQIIYADPLKLKQIIYNLLSNAIKFTEKGMISFEFLDKKYNWEFYIKDTGIGIAKKDYEIIFKDFKRVKSPYIDSIPGSGLGLSLTKRIIQLHGGDISFTSKLGKGSTFIFNIPKKNKNLNRTLRGEQLINYL